LIVKKTKLAMDDLYTEDNSPRWILNLKVISEFNLMLLKNLAKKEATYSDMGHLMTGAYGKIRLQQTQIYRLKGRDDCCFGYVRVLMCTNITYTQKTAGYLPLF
jgi:hypothetical protein